MVNLDNKATSTFEKYSYEWSGHRIGGVWCQHKIPRGQKFYVYNPSNGRELFSFTTDQDDAKHALKHALLGQEKYKKWNLQDRLGVLSQISYELQKLKQSLIISCQIELGKTLQEATEEVEFAISYIKWAEKTLGNKTIIKVRLYFYM